MSPDPTLANVEPNFFEFHGHPRTAIAAKAEAVLFPDMGQHFHIRPLPPTDRSRTPGSIAALTDKHDTPEQFNGPPVPPAMHKSEPHVAGLRSNPQWAREELRGRF
jgi:hypothetical protein